MTIAGSERIINDFLNNEKPKWLATCNKVATVFHFSWSALGCQHCGTMVDKYDWKLL